jgi:hypothetical protein
MDPILLRTFDSIRLRPRFQRPLTEVPWVVAPGQLEEQTEDIFKSYI